jgi:hypothetical protein
MNEQNRARLTRMVARWERQRAALAQDEAEREREAIFRADLARVMATVLRPVIEDIGAELRRAGHDYRVEEGSPEGSPRLDLYLLVRGRSGSKDLIQFVVRRDPERGSELIAELVLRGPPFELHRFSSPSELTADLAEHLLVDTVEQILASPPA